MDGLVRGVFQATRPDQQLQVKRACLLFKFVNDVGDALPLHLVHSGGDGASVDVTGAREEQPSGRLRDFVASCPNQDQEVEKAQRDSPTPVTVRYFTAALADIDFEAH